MPEAKHGSDPHQPLTVLEISNHRLIYFSGTNSHGKWHAPGIICNVDEKAGTFQVISLDDMQLVNQLYPIEPSTTDDVRASMTLANPHNVKTYVRLEAKGKNRASYWQAILKAIRSVRAHNAEIADYKNQARELGFI